jgi:hypothetical protein
MKECPKCGFTFPDFHHVCDFDGTNLVPEPSRPPLVNLSRPKSRFRRCLKSPLFLASVTTFALLSSALLIGYFDSANQPGPVAKSAPAASSDNVVPVVRASNRSPARIKTPVHSARVSNIVRSHSWARFSASARRHATSTHSVTRSHQATYVGSASRNSEVARQRDPQPMSRSQISNPQQSARAQPISHPQQTSHDKDSKLTAMLKSTWHVLKRPFKF